jgi:hypothetical protein
MQQPEYPYILKRNFPFHQLSLDLLLSESDLENEREREFKGRKKKALVHLGLPPAT